LSYLSIEVINYSYSSVFLMHIFKKIIMKKTFLLLVAIALLIACNQPDSEIDPNLPQPITVKAAENVPYNIIAQHPHDVTSYTQGLQYFNGKMYEGTGDYEKSALKIVDYKTGKSTTSHNIGKTPTDSTFGEGITILNNKIYQLTWQDHLVYLYDVKDITKPIKTFNWPYEGWGITNNGKDLIVSDGSARLYFVSPDSFTVKQIVKVNSSEGFVDNINELEYIDGFVYANVYLTDNIIKIDPTTGNVVGTLNFAGVLKQFAPNFSPKVQDEVLNGIAYDSTTKKMFVTGKRWPILFEIQLK
jgi:glutaminyl-peptide cyclotransferase